jgi:HEAT repeat protein
MGEWASGRVGEAVPVVRKKWEPVDPRQPVERLLRRATRDVEKEVNRKDADVAWSELKAQGTNALAYLVTRLDTPNVWLRAKVEELVDYLGTNSAPVLVAGMRNARNDEVARVCCFFLARFPTATNEVSSVLPLLHRKDTRVTALYTLGHWRVRELYGPATAGLTDTNELVRLRSAQALGRLGDRRAIPKLIVALNDELWDVRYAASDALVAMGKPAVAPLRVAYARATPRARAHIIEALAKLGDPRSETLARKYYRQDDPLLRDAVLKRL